MPCTPTYKAGAEKERERIAEYLEAQADEYGAGGYDDEQDALNHAAREIRDGLHHEAKPTEE